MSVDDICKIMEKGAGALVIVLPCVMSAYATWCSTRANARAKDAKKETAEHGERIASLENGGVSSRIASGVAHGVAYVRAGIDTGEPFDKEAFAAGVQSMLDEHKPSPKDREI